MNKQFYENLLKDFTKANKTRKLVLAQKAGCNSVEEYKTMLESQLNADESLNTLKEAVKTTGLLPTGGKVFKKKPVIYVADVIDCSGSMAGDKLNSAVKGINDGVIEMQKETKVEYKHLLCDFSYSYDINFSEVTPIDKVFPIRFKDRGMTALRDAVAQTIRKLSGVKLKGEKVLVNIYTDGADNCSSTSNSSLKETITQAEKDGFTITFIGTESDTKDVVSKLNIDSSNTMSYDGSAQGLEYSMQQSNIARGIFAKKVLKGEDVKKGFYKNIIK